MADLAEWGLIALEHLRTTRAPERLLQVDALVLERVAWGAGQTNWYY